MVVYDTLRKALSVCFTDVDFAPYFAFIESLPLLQAGGHKHHILPKKEFPAFSKDPNNLIRVTPADHFKAHYWLALCAPEFLPFQRVFFFMTGFKRYAPQLNTNELPRYVEIYEKGATEQKAWARELGFVQGKKNVESGHLKSIAAAGGRNGGRTNVESGHLARIRTPENLRAAGRAAGKKAVENGHLKRASAIAGQKNIESGWADELGRRAVESGQLQSINQLALHTRWHANRDLVNPACGLCRANEGIQ